MESLFERLAKVEALAKRGSPNERKNAERILRRMRELNPELRQLPMRISPAVREKSERKGFDALNLPGRVPQKQSSEEGISLVELWLLTFTVSTIVCLSILVYVYQLGASRLH